MHVLGLHAPLLQLRDDVLSVGVTLERRERRSLHALGAQAAQVLGQARAEQDRALLRMPDQVRQHRRLEPRLRAFQFGDQIAAHAPLADDEDLQP
jgi:hypothetical protein